MLKIRGMDIYYIRGDDDSFTIQPVQADGTPITGYNRRPSPSNVPMTIPTTSCNARWTGQS